MITTLHRGKKKKKRCEQNSPTAGVRVQKAMIFGAGAHFDPRVFFLALYFFPTKIKLIIGETKQVISKKVIEVVQACVYFLPTSASNIAFFFG